MWQDLKLYQKFHLDEQDHSFKMSITQLLSRAQSQDVN